MKFNPRDAALWFFCWASTDTAPRRGYPTPIVAFSRTDLIKAVERELAQPWRKTYREGGRAVRCRVTPI
jgi:hypothetical protein